LLGLISLLFHALFMFLDFSAQLFPLVSNFKLLLSFHFLTHLPVSVL
jgi:hypothetical protein